MKKCAIAMLCASMLVPTIASAHHRDFIMLRDWFLPYKGEREIEYRLFHVNRENENLHEAEFEWGVNNHFAIEPGLSWHSMDDENLHIDGFDCEFRFSFGDFKPNTPLFALNLEFEHPFDREEPDHGEAKFIASYYTNQGGNFTVNLNLGTELNKDREKEGEILVGYVHPINLGKSEAADRDAQFGGYSDTYRPGLRVGFEAKMDFQEHYQHFGPTVVYRVNQHFNILANYHWAVNKRHESSDGFGLIAEWEF